MADLGKIQFTGGDTPADTFGSWTNITSASATTTASILNFSDGVDTGWDITVNVSASTGTQGVNAVGTGDAAWVDEAVVSVNYHWISSGTMEFDIDNLNDSNTYHIRVFPSRDTIGTDRVGDYTVDGFSTFETVDAGSGGNSTEIAEFLSVSPVSGTITVEVQVSSGASFAYVNAIEIEEVDSAGGTILPFITKYYRGLN